MPVERAAGIILFRNTRKGRRYLVIRSSRKDKTKPEFWDFPKGLLEKGETGIDAAKREAEEEVGINEFELVPGFKKTTQYFIIRDQKRKLKFVVMFLARSKTDKVKLSWEHDRHEWMVYQEAQKRITQPKMKDVLDVAEKSLKSK